ncbi:MAG: hypothetical protein ICV64_00050 [Thermoleophilia bacterium]|nr:hypothetical protein [Thermoleophilia bacterium]
MYATHTTDALAVARTRGEELRAQAAFERGRTPNRRSALATSLRRTADRLDPAPLLRAAASRS